MTKIIINESQFHHILTRNNILTENRASKNQSLARRMVRELSPNLDDKEFTEEVLHYIPNARKENFHLFPAMVRFLLNNKNGINSRTISELNKYVGIIAPKAKELGLDQNLNGMSVYEFLTKFKTDVENSEANDRKDSAQYDTNNNGDFNGYKIVPIPTFKKAQEYSKYTDWCITQRQDNYNSYTDNEMGMFYFLLKDGFENVPKKKGPNCPLDEYGLSMIAVSFRADGSLNSITCRWNHGNGGNDTIMTPKQVSELIGTDIYSIFSSDDTTTDLLDGIKPIRLIKSVGLILFYDKDKDSLFVSNRYLENKAYFDKKKFVVYNGDNDEGRPISALIDSDGYNLAYSYGYDYHLTIEIVNDIMFVACINEESYGSGIYNIKNSPEKLNIIERLESIETVGNLLILSEDLSTNFIYNKSRNEFIYETPIDEVQITTYERDKYVICIKSDHISLINVETGDITLPWSQILNTNNKLMLVRSKDNGYLLVSSAFGLVTPSHITDTYEIIHSQNLPKRCKYIVMYGNEGRILLDNLYAYTSISQEQVKQLGNNINKIDINKIFN